MAQQTPPSTKSDLIKNIYIYFFLALGLIVFLIGLFQLSQAAAKQFLLPRYPLGYEETRCDYLAIPIEPVVMPDTKVDQSTNARQQEEQKKQKDMCLSKLEETRKTQMVTDYGSAIAMIVIGLGVFSFHLSALRKKTIL